MVAAAVGGWLAAAVTSGPLGWPAHLLTWIYLAGAIGGYRWLRRHEAVRAARQRRDDARRVDRPQSRMAPDRAPDRPGRLPPAGGHPDAAGRGAAAHQRPRQRTGHPRSGRTAGRTRRSTRTCEACPTAESTSRTTEYPGQLVIEVREKDPSVNGPVTHPALDPDSPFTDWFPRARSIRNPVPIGVIPETGEPMELVLFDDEGGKADRRLQHDRRREDQHPRRDPGAGHRDG